MPHEEVVVGSISFNPSEDIVPDTSLMRSKSSQIVAEQSRAEMLRECSISLKPLTVQDISKCLHHCSVNLQRLSCRDIKQNGLRKCSVNLKILTQNNMEKYVKTKKCIQAAQVVKNYFKAALPFTKNNG